MNFQTLLQQVCAYNGWPMTFTNGGARIEIPTEYGRSQVVDVSVGQDPNANQLVYVWSNIATTNYVQDPWYLLQCNANLAYGGIAVRDNQVFLMDSMMLQTADAQTLVKIMYYIANTADQFEKQWVGYDNN